MDNNFQIPENLKKAGKEHPFRVPENYFENFAGRLQDRINKEQKVPAAARLITMARPYLGMAAMITAILLITWFGYRQVISDKQNRQLNNTELSDIVDYCLHDYDEDLLISTVIETGEVNGIVPLEGFSEEIMDFLSVDGIDYSLLIEYK